MYAIRSYYARHTKPRTLPGRLTIFGYRPTTRQEWSSDLRKDKHYVNHVSEIRDMRSRYIAGLLKRGWNTILGFIGGHGRRGIDDHALSGNSVIDAQHQRLSRYADELKTTLDSGRPVGDSIVITSYSIHYTKLYESLRSSSFKA